MVSVQVPLAVVESGEADAKACSIVCEFGRSCEVVELSDLFVPHLHERVLKEERKVVHHREDHHDAEEGLGLFDGAEGGGLVRFTDGDVAVECNQDRYPHSGQLADVREGVEDHVDDEVVTAVEV